MRGKWTAGPWFMSGARQKVGGADTHSVVATVGGKEIIIASVWYNPITHEGFHDARLIARTPALHDALAELRDAASEFEAHRDDIRSPVSNNRLLAAIDAADAALSLAHPHKGEEL